MSNGVRSAVTLQHNGKRQISPLRASGLASWAFGLLLDFVATRQAISIQKDTARRDNVIRGNGQHKLAEEVSSNLGRNLTVACYGKEGELPDFSFGRLSMRCNFKSENEKADSDITRIDKLFERYFPKCKRIWVNLLTSEIHLEELFSADKRLVEWTDADADKWLHIQRSGPPPDGIPTAAYLEYYL